MDYLKAMQISASGMSVERLRLDATAVNLANVNSTKDASGGVFKPLQVISGSRTSAVSFSTALDQAMQGVEVKEMRKLEVPPRLVFEPNHPDADAKGFVSYPGINSVTEMVTLVSTMRAYEANVVAANVAKTLALKTLEIGGNS